MGNANRWRVVLALIVMNFALALRAQTTRPSFNIAGHALAPDGKPVPRADVALYAYSAPPVNAPPVARATTDAQGQYKVQSETQNYTLVVQAAGFGLFVTTGSAIDDQPIDLHLKPTTTVRIMVIDSDAKPLPGVRVGLASMRERAVPAGAGVVPLELAERLARATDENGVCTLTGMPRETSLSVRLFDDRYLSERGPVPITEPVLTTDADVLDAPPIRAERSAIIEGRVTRSDTGQSVAGVSVVDRIVNINVTGGTTGSTADAKTDADGKFRLTQLIAGQHTISLTLSPPVNAELTTRVLTQSI